MNKDAVDYDGMSAEELRSLIRFRDLELRRLQEVYDDLSHKMGEIVRCIEAFRSSVDKNN